MNQFTETSIHYLPDLNELFPINYDCNIIHICDPALPIKPGIVSLSNEVYLCGLDSVLLGLPTIAAGLQSGLDSMYGVIWTIALLNPLNGVLTDQSHQDKSSNSKDYFLMIKSNFGSLHTSVPDLVWLCLPYMALRWQLWGLAW